MHLCRKEVLYTCLEIKDVDIMPVIVIIPVYLLPLVPPNDYVVKSTLKFDPRFPCHDIILLNPYSNSNRQV
jgi:hypothetical protein